ncbi:tRNA-Thr(GGU) m(6)t(6)A37 methyltransferase TsaA [Thiopseudomonas denitrificans]|uniref:tRNA-Thr(GGU) m(6)t(6)A37 methyltransferase TsaA n=1 Tax=Thiopseudomonas denitrificans TaxID=1501432 RepID=A0A4R6U6E8_9GAMM|nr:tRNA-Thr(GGU) m(6)t(6)A37 methyltransferase TsaA [Thiopseudomonas denitrificans]
MPAAGFSRRMPLQAAGCGILFLLPEALVDSFQLQVIGEVRSCFKEKFAIPRQPALAPAARGIIELRPPYNQPHALAGLEQVSHVWVIFLFHQALDQQHRLQVRPPRLGGNQRLGVFASRASHRPNSIGQSLVRLERIDEECRLHISGIDLLDGTPVLDIKPYIPFVESVPDAWNRIAEQPPALLPVDWQPAALASAREHARRLQEPLVELIEQCLAQDPKPAYQQPEPSRQYGARLHDVNVVWCYPEAGRVLVLLVE